MPRRPILRPSTWPAPIRAAIAWAAVAALLWVSLAPTRDLPGVELVWDKAEHTGTYLALTALGLALYPTRPGCIAGFLLLLGAGVEGLQAGMGFGRQGDWRDFVANGLGIVAAVVIWRLAFGRRTAAA